MEIINIYNGNIIYNNDVINFKEFKIISPKKFFQKVKFHCAWFIYKLD